MMIEKALTSRKANSVRSERLDLLRQRINNEEYLHAAIQRLALVLSYELMEINTKGGGHGKKRK